MIKRKYIHNSEESYNICMTYIELDTDLVCTTIEQVEYRIEDGVWSIWDATIPNTPTALDKNIFNEWLMENNHYGCSCSYGSANDMLSDWGYAGPFIRMYGTVSAEVINYLQSKENNEGGK